jgi:membrane associated rhomboid family serine protease
LLSAAFFLIFAANTALINTEGEPVEQDQYQENQPPQDRHDRQPIFNLPTIVIVFIVACCLMHAVRIYILTPEQDFAVMVFGAFIPARYTPFTAFDLASVTSTISYSLLHGSVSHLLNNCLWLAVFGSPLANTIGTLRFVMFWCVCSIIAAAFHYYGQPTDMAPMIGASGAIAGLMGAAARFGFVMNKQIGASRFNGQFPALKSIFANRTVLTFLGVFLVTNLLIGSGQFEGLGVSIAWQAHIGGIIGGFLLIPLFLPSQSYH